ncbi:unnamed protein product, partial [Brenthis ino]
MRFLFLLVLFTYACEVLTKDNIAINFIKQFIDNERKPTSFVCINLCWKNWETLNLFKELNDVCVQSSLTFNEKSHFQDHALLFFVDLDCPNAEALFNVPKLLRFPYRWLAVYDREQYKFNVTMIWDLPLLADSDFVLAERTGDNYTLIELHKPSPAGPTYSNPRGYYNGTLIDTRPHRELFRRRQNIMGHPLTMANVIQDSNSSQYHLPREDRLELHLDSIAKISWINVHIAFQMLNATPRYIFSHRWGFKQNGQWSGMINDLNTGRADLGSVLKTDQMQLDGGIGDAILLTLSALGQQGCSKEPKKLAGRIMVWIIFTALMALYAAYSANIVVLLQASSNSIRTLEELVDSKVTLAALEVDYNHFILKAHKDPVRLKIYKKIEPDKGKAEYYGLNEGVERVRKGLFAFHVIAEQLYRRVEETFLDTEKCDLVEVDFMNILDPFVPVYKFSPYLELLRIAFKRIHESGIQVAINKRIHVTKPHCSDKITKFSSVSFLNIRPLLLFMLIGIAISIVILMLEIIHEK